MAAKLNSNIMTLDTKSLDMVTYIVLPANSTIEDVSSPINSTNIDKACDSTVSDSSFPIDSSLAGFDIITVIPNTFGTAPEIGSVASPTTNEMVTSATNLLAEENKTVNHNSRSSFNDDRSTCSKTEKSAVKRPYRQYCSALNCNSTSKNSPDLSFFRFPKDQQRCKRWLTNVRREDLLRKSSTALYHSQRLCAKHFEDYMFSNNIKTRLFHHAVPTLFDVLTLPKHVKRKKPNKSRNMKKKTTETNDLSTTSTMTETSIVQQNESGSPSLLQEFACEDHKSAENEMHTVATETEDNLVNDCSCIECRPGMYQDVGTQTEPFVISLEEKKRVRSKINSLQRKIKSLESKLKAANEMCANAPVSSEKALEKLKSELPNDAFYLLQSMLKLTKERYSQEEKEFFKAFYHHARSGYSYLRERGIHMPHPKTVQKWKKGLHYEIESSDVTDCQDNSLVTEQQEHLVLEESEDPELAYSIAIIATNDDLQSAVEQNVQFCLI